MHYQENVATLPLSAVRRTLGTLPVTSVVCGGEGGTLVLCLDRGGLGLS